VSLVFMPRKEIPWKGLLISAAAIVLLSSPMVFFILTRDIGQIGWVTRPGLKEIAWVFSQLSGRGGPILTLAYFIPGAISLFFTVRMCLHRKLSFQLWRYTFLLSWLFLPIVLAFAYSFIKPIFVIRYLIICLPPLVFLVADGLGRIKQRWLTLTALGVLVLLSSFALRDWYTSSQNEDYTQKDNWRGATSYIVSSAETGDAIVFFHPMLKLPFDYYHGRLKAPDDIPAAVHYLPVPEESLNIYYLPESYSSNKVLPTPEKGILDRLSGYKRVWLVLGYDFGPEKKEQSRMIQDFLEEEYSITAEKVYFDNIRVYLYTLKGP
jgi:hypothetical protein